MTIGSWTKASAGSPVAHLVTRAGSTLLTTECHIALDRRLAAYASARHICEGELCLTCLERSREILGRIRDNAKRRQAGRRHAHR